MKVKWNGNFQVKTVRKFWFTSQGCPFFRNLCEFIYYSELDISRKDDGGAYSILLYGGECFTRN